MKVISNFIVMGLLQVKARSSRKRGKGRTRAMRRKRLGREVRLEGTHMVNTSTMGSVWLEMADGALYVDTLGVCADAVPRGNLELEAFVGARFVGAVDATTPLGLGNAPLPGTRPLFVVHDAQGSPSLLRAPEVLAVVLAVSALATGEHAAVDLDPDPTSRFSRTIEDDRPTLKNLSDAQ